MCILKYLKKYINTTAEYGVMENQMLQNNTDDYKHNVMRDTTIMDKTEDNTVNLQDCNEHSQECSDRVWQQSFKSIEERPIGTEPRQRSDLYAGHSEITTVRIGARDSVTECDKTENNIHSEYEPESNVDITDDCKVDETSPDNDQDYDNSEKAFDYFSTDDKLVRMESKLDNGIRFEEIEDRYVIGDIAGTFKQVPFVSEKKVEEKFVFKRHDIVADIAKIDNLLIMGASLRGESHFAHKTVRQDSFVFDSFISNEGRCYAIAVI